MRRRPSASELLAWALVGAAAGIAAGFAAGELLGPRKTRRPRSDNRFPGAPLGPAAATRSAARALGEDPLLGSINLHVIPVGPGLVELHGWVADRALRARAARLVTACPGIERVVNRLLVQGEDDPAEPAPDVTKQPA